MKKIILIIFGIDILLSAHFIRTNGIVKDTRTHLEWQDNYNSTADKITKYSWMNAISYCENLVIDGKSDWRLPNKKELVTIIDYKIYNPSINSTFQKSFPGNYWSSTSVYPQHLKAWTVYFYAGFMSPEYNKTSSFSVRCVR